MMRPGVPAALVGGGVDGVRVARVDRDVADAGVLRDRQDGRPGGAAVARLVQAPVAPGSPQRSLRGHVHDSGVARVDDDPADVLGALQPDVAPAPAAVVGPVDAVSPRHRALAVVLPGPDPDGVGVAGVQRHAADRVGALAVEHRRPRRAVVLGLPDTARRHRDEVAVGARGIDCEVSDATGGERGADAAEREACEVLGGHDVRLRGAGGRRLPPALAGEARRRQRQRDNESEFEALHRDPPCGMTAQREP